MATWATEVPAVHRTGVEAVREEPSDLIERARSGDLAAFREVVEHYSSRIHAIAYRMVGNSEDAQDIAQEVFLKLYRSLDKFDPRYPFATWLYRLTVNLAIDYRRGNVRHRHVSLDEIEDESVFEDDRPGPDVHAEWNELRGALDGIAGELPPKQRKVFVLRDLQGFSTEEVAKILRCRPATIRVHLAQARGQVKEADRLAPKRRPPRVEAPVAFLLVRLCRMSGIHMLVKAVIPLDCSLSFRQKNACLCAWIRLYFA